MPLQLTSGRIDPQLTNVLLAYTNAEYIADMIMPTIPNLAQEAGHIPQLGNAHLRQYSSKRSLNDTSGHRMEFSLSNDATYQIDYYDLEAYVSDRVQAQLQSPFDAKNIAQLSTYEAMKLEREIALATLMNDETILTNYVTLSTSSDKYTDGDNSDPAGDFDTARDSVHSLTGREANMIVMSREVANALRRHPWFLEIAQSSLKGGAPKVGALSMSAFVETLKSWYEGLEYVCIGKNIKITTNEGQTETKSQVWQNNVVWAYRAPSPSLMIPSFAYSFQLAGQNLVTDVRREPMAGKGDIVRVNWAYDDKILDVNSAYLIKSAI
jgi:membrane-bound inhibitor of C-type lysozyme